MADDRSQGPTPQGPQHGFPPQGFPPQQGVPPQHAPGSGPQKAEARADANVAALTKGDIIQFERKGYYIFDGVVGGRHEFIHIPDGRAASIASKAGAQTGTATPADGAKKDAKAASKKGASSDTPAEAKMYNVARVYGEDDVIPAVETKMYRVQSVYDS